MSDRPKISFIIPAHNAGDYLGRAVCSVAEGEWEFSIEVLVIENGSEDDTLEVAKEMEERYDCVKLLHSETGVSAARNAGLDAAVGEWIFFLDADDYVTNRIRSTLEQDIEDIRVDLYVYSYEKGPYTVYVCDGPGRDAYVRAKIENCRVSMLEDPTRCMAVWGKLFKRDIISEHSLRFAENLKLAEDSDFLIRYTKYCRRIIFCRNVAYHYSTIQGSSIRTYDGEMAQEYVKSLITTEKWIKADSERIQDAFQIYVLMHLNVIMVREVFCVDNPEFFIKKIKMMKRILRVGIFRNALEQVPLKACRSSRMLPVLLLKCRMYLLCGIAYQMRARQNYKREN